MTDTERPLDDALDRLEQFTRRRLDEATLDLLDRLERSQRDGTLTLVR